MLAGDATGTGDFVPSLLVLSKVLKLLTSHVIGDITTSAFLILRRKEGSDNPKSIMVPIEVRFHGAIQAIRDFDSAVAYIYIFSVQAVLAGDATSTGDFLPSLLVLSKVLKLLTAHVTGDIPTSTFLNLRRKEGSDNMEGFFGSSLRGGNDKRQLIAFRGAILREAYSQYLLSIKTRNHHMEAVEKLRHSFAL